MLNGQIQSIRGTSGSTPFAAATLAILSAREPLASRPRARVGFINPRLCQLYKQHLDLLYDVVSGRNDVTGVGCCAPRTRRPQTAGG